MLIDRERAGQSREIGQAASRRQMGRKRIRSQVQIPHDVGDISPRRGETAPQLDFSAVDAG
jgi:hypothetical protein